MAKTLKLSGRDLQKAIIEVAHLHGWKVAHFASVPITRRGKTFYATPVEADGKGWPDLFCVRETRALAIEVKGDGDRMRDEQILWLAALLHAGIETYTWTPKQLRNGSVEFVLQ